METSKLPVTQPDGRFVTDQSEVCDFTTKSDKRVGDLWRA